MSGGGLVLTGDLMMLTPGSVEQYHDDAGFQVLREELRGAAVAVANLEVPLSRRGAAVPKTFNLRADSAVIGDIAALEITAVTLANNHVMDFGPEALADTIAACEEAGIVHTGAGDDLKAAMAPLWFTVDGTRVALLSVACTLPPASEALPDRAGVAPLRVRFAFEIDSTLLVEQPGTVPLVWSWAVAEDQERVAGAIATCRADGAEAVIVAIHWGSPAYWLSPYQGLLCAYQRPLAHALIEAGADAIVGHHPHQLHPIEVYQGKPILYSLGNFIFEGISQLAWMGREAVMARFHFGEQPACELVPIVLDGRGFPRLAVGDEAEEVIGAVRELSCGYETRIGMRGGVGVVTL
jgi:poly-gamma-glutamate synthesis protein (capsule biosynthesis protein)